MKLKLISIIISAALLIIPCGCAQNEKPESVSFQAMDTFMKLDVYGDRSAAEKIKNQIAKLDSLLSPTDEKSDIFMLNRDKKATADELTAELTKKSLEICEQTVGALDVTIYPIVREWGFISGDYKIRLDVNECPYNLPDEIVAQITEAVGKIAFNRYPDPLATKLAEAFSRFYGIDPQNVTVGNGSDELIFLVESAFLEKGDKMLVVSPDFSMYQGREF